MVRRYPLEMMVTMRAMVEIEWRFKNQKVPSLLHGMNEGGIEG